MPGIIGIHQYRYPKDDNKWRPNTRQDIFTHSRYLLWKPHLPPVYTNPKNPLMPAAMAVNYNRYGLPPIPSVMHRPNYMFAMPTTKVNNYSYRKDLGTKSKPGNFHHITIINAIIPKPYLPLPTMSFQNGQQSLRSHRNNKQLFYYNMNTGRPNVNASKSRTSPQLKRPLIQHGHLLENVTSAVQPTTGQQTKTFYSNNGQNVNQNNINGDASVGTLKCVQMSSGGFLPLSTNVPNHYCNMLNYYENESNKREIQPQQILPTPTSLTTTATSEKSPRADLGVYTSPKSIFLPTVYGSHVKFSAETTTADSKKAVDTILKTTTTAASLTRSDAHAHSFFTANSKKAVDTILRTTTTPASLTWSDANAHSFFTANSKKAVDTILRTTTTAASHTRSDAHAHSFFTIEDAITSAPPRNYVFNNPYEALSHARKRKELHSKRQMTKDSDVGAEKNSFFMNFFDDNAESTSEVLDFNTSKFYSPAPYFSYRNEGLNTNQDSTPQTNSQFADLYGHIRNSDGRWKQHLDETPVIDDESDKSTTTTQPIMYGNSSGKTTTSSEVSNTTPATTPTTVHEEIKSEAATTQSASEIPIITTVPSLSTTSRSKVKKSRLKRPFYGRSTPAYKTPKTSGGLFAALKNSTSTSTTPATTKKKSHKYQRQYKPKKGKHVKSLSRVPTTSSPLELTQSTASTTISSTTKESRNSNKVSYRTVTGSSPTEATATRATSKVNSERLLAHQPRDSQRLKGFKRTQKGRNGTTTKPRPAKSRRRVYTSSTTAKPHTMSSLSLAPPSTAATSLSSYTTTTTSMKSTTRKSSSEFKSKLHTLKTSTRTSPNEVNDHSSADSKPSSRTVKPPSTRDVHVPPLPIEIYFKNSHNTHI